MKTLVETVLVLAAVLLHADVASAQAGSKTSGVYQTAADYQAKELSFQGACGSGAHKLELHDVLNKPYIDVTHDHEKRRYSKSDVFGFRACDGRDYRFGENLEYQILRSESGLHLRSRNLLFSAVREKQSTA